MDTVAIKAYLNSKDNPQLSYKTIHIGGSNGKGSTGFFLSQMLVHLGFNVGYIFHHTQWNDSIISSYKTKAYKMP